MFNGINSFRTNSNGGGSSGIANNTNNGYGYGISNMLNLNMGLSGSNSYNSSSSGGKNSSSRIVNNNNKDDVGIKKAYYGPEHTRSLPPLPPSRDYSQKEADQVLADAMNQLSIKEREEVYEDLHGISSNSIEDLEKNNPQYVEECLQKLEEMICSIQNDTTTSEKRSHAYEQAKQQCAEYVTNRKFRLQFLRADSYNVEHAAIRLLAYFEAKLELFGVEKLARDITQNDLSSDDMSLLESGYVQVLNQRDTAGRPIFFVVNWAANKNNFRCRENKLRAMWYITQCTLKDESAQLKGFVSVLYTIGSGAQKAQLDRVTLWKALHITHVFPQRYVAMHFCYNNPKLKWMISIASTVFESRTRTRFRCHYGTNVECIYKLMTFGIPADILPVNSAGKLVLHYHKEFLKTQKQLEKQLQLLDTIENIIIVPNSYDVLLGRGRTFRSNPGNIRFHNIIETHFEKYESSNRTVKLVLSEEVVIEIKNLGSRFLKQTETGGWIQVTDDFARERVAHAFRNRRLSAASKGSGSNGPNGATTTTSTKNNINNNTTRSIMLPGGVGGGDGGVGIHPNFEEKTSILSRPLVDTENSCLFTNCKRRKLISL